VCTVAPPQNLSFVVPTFSAGLRQRGACSISRAAGPKLKKYLSTC